MYTVIGSAKNRTVRVLWALEEMGLPYDHVPAAPGSEKAIEITNTGKVPALQFDGQVFTDSVAIITFLADRHSQLTFEAGSSDRLTQDGHMNFLIEEFDTLLWTAAKHSFVLPQAQRVKAVKPSIKWEFQRSFERLERRLIGPFLMGDTLTIADIVAVHCLNWAYIARFPATSEKLLDYGKRLRARPAYQRAVANA